MERKQYKYEELPEDFRDWHEATKQYTPKPEKNFHKEGDGMWYEGRAPLADPLNIANTLGK